MKKIVFYFLAVFLFFGWGSVVSGQGYTITTPFPGIAKGAEPTIAQYLGSLFTFALAIIGVVAIGAIVYWSIVWTTSGGNASLKGQAKSGMWQAVIGIIFLLASYLILNTINPDLVNIGETERRLISIPQVNLPSAEEESGPAGSITTELAPEVCPPPESSRFVINLAPSNRTCNSYGYPDHTWTKCRSAYYCNPPSE